MSDLIGRLLGGGASTPSQPKTKMVLDLSRTSFEVGDQVESLSSGRVGKVELVYTGVARDLVLVSWGDEVENVKVSNLVHVVEVEAIPIVLEPKGELRPLAKGDRVRILRSCAHRGEESSNEHQRVLVGRAGTVVGLGGQQRNKEQFGDPPYPAGGDTTRYQVKADGDTNIWWYFREALELLPAAVAVAVGDRVQVGNDEAVVESIREHDTFPLLIRFAVDGSASWFQASAVAANLGQPTFEVGDRVITVSPATGIEDGIGERGVIQCTYESETEFGLQYDVKLDSGTSWLYQPGALSLADEPEPERYRIGDRLEARTGAQAVLERRLDSGEYQLRLLDGKPLVRSEQILDERWEVLEGYRNLVLIDDWVVIEGHPLGVREPAVIGEVVKVVEVAHNGSLLVERHGSEADGWWFQFGALALADPPDGEE